MTGKAVHGMMDHRFKPEINRTKTDTEGLVKCFGIRISTCIGFIWIDKSEANIANYYLIYGNTLFPYRRSAATVNLSSLSLHLYNMLLLYAYVEKHDNDEVKGVKLVCD